MKLTTTSADGQRIAATMTSVEPPSKLMRTLLQHAAAARSPQTCPTCGAKVGMAWGGGRIVDLGFAGVRCTYCYKREEA